MSTILKALRRLEDDRQDGSQRDLRLEVAARAPHSKARPRGIGPLLALGGGATIAFAGMALWFVSTEPSVQQSAAEPATAGMSEFTGAAAPVRRFIATPTLPPPVAAAPPRRLRPSLEVVAPSVAIPAPPPRVTPAARVVPPPPEVAVAPRRPLPELRVRRTIWHPERARRLAVVDVAGGDGPVELREGTRLGSLVVLEILPNGVTFGRDGVEFVRRVGGAPGRY